MIEIRNLLKKYDGNLLFSDFSLFVNDGEFVVFSGPSGCGKTTLLNIIGALEPFDSGTIVVDGLDVSKRKVHLKYFREKVGFLFQNFALVDNKTVKENLKMIRKGSRTELSIEEALRSVGLEGKIDNKIYTLSGGEQQRVALARLMLKKCDVILADEPTGSLDHANTRIVLDILKNMNKQGKTVILVTHDEFVKSQFERVVFL
ncbi:ATP-binding cassette domain-containing protein [Peribacillus frigoritolerans]|uniref:ATP-binding cassette domain-containing protein n=1 Tax=Peribacillus frigoritolerans TaxID=450367 RepID=UPI002E229301|nr:ATP-binding cassette domain-containing protein [Peribacillus frigoritolerans]MED4690702.1 ATP-binding cassette domain-containing protein [Peribacillus frigoritolerans]